MTPGICVGFIPRALPLEPAAVAARGPAARLLAQRVLRLSDKTFSRLSGIGGHDLLILIGEGPDLPWVDGVCYLGRDPRAPSLLVRCEWEPTVPPEILEEALLRKAGPSPRPLAVMEPDLVCPVGHARPLSRTRLSSLVEAPR
jgi:hypothetical protein